MGVSASASVLVAVSSFKVGSSEAVKSVVASSGTGSSWVAVSSGLGSGKWSAEMCSISSKLSEKEQMLFIHSY